MTGLNATWAEFPSPNLTAGMANLTSYANQVTEGYFGFGILITLWIILFLSFKKWGDMESITIATFLTTVIAGLLRAMNVITDQPFVALIMLTGLSMLIMWRRSS